MVMMKYAQYVIEMDGIEEVVCPNCKKAFYIKVESYMTEISMEAKKK